MKNNQGSQIANSLMGYVYTGRKLELVWIPRGMFGLNGEMNDGNVTIQATRTAGAPNGTGKGSNLTVQGSSIQAAGTTTLKADNQVNLLAAANTTSESSTNQSKSASVGVAMQLGAGGGMGVTASASKATGQGAGNGVTYTNTQVAGNTVNIESGGDTTLKGAVVKADQVTAKVGTNPSGSGGNLSIQSLQDQNQYKESSKSAGGSIMVGAGVSGSVNLAKSSINSQYQSVGEQSAIRAGDGGFQVEVKGNTTLTGAQITSTQAAIDKNKDNNKNGFQTGGTLTTTDLQNKASYEAKSVSVGVGAGALPGKSASAGMSGVGFGSDSGNAASTSTAGISGVAGNTAARTGDKETGIGQVFNKDQVKAEVNAQVAITSEFGKQASKVVGDYAQTKFEEAKTNKDQAGIDAWKEGGTSRVALHAVVGGLTGGASGAVGAATSQAVIDQVGQALKDTNLPTELKQALVLAAGTVVGSATGGSAGAATAFNATANNYLSSTDLKNRDQRLAAARKSGNVQEELRILKEYDAKSAKNTGAINYNSVLTEGSLQAEKTQLEQLVKDAATSPETKAQAQRSINELNTAINVIQKSPVLRDAAELGLIALDVLTLGELAGARVLTSAVVKEFVAAKTGKVITDDAAAVISNNFYRDGAPINYGASRVVTNPNEAVFWSGRTDGVGGINAAKMIADQNKGRTLEQLIETRKIDMPVYDPTVPSSVQAWQSISTELAKNASGDVRAVLGSQVRPQSIWELFELPALINNPAVHKVIGIDPKTGSEKIIFQRGVK